MNTLAQQLEQFWRLDNMYNPTCATHRTHRWPIGCDFDLDFFLLAILLAFCSRFRSQCSVFPCLQLRSLDFARVFARDFACDLACNSSMTSFVFLPYFFPAQILLLKWSPHTLLFCSPFFLAIALKSRSFNRAAKTIDPSLVTILNALGWRALLFPNSNNCINLLNHECYIMHW